MTIQIKDNHEDTFGEYLIVITSLEKAIQGLESLHEMRVFSDTLWNLGDFLTTLKSHCLESKARAFECIDRRDWRGSR